MSDIKKSQLDAVDTRVEVMLRKLFEGRSVNFEDLNGVDILNADDEDTIFYNFTLDLWENHPLKTINGESLKGPGNIVVGGGGGSGTVTSVGLSLPSIFSVASSPVTGAGTIAASLVVQPANRVWAGPTTGADAAPTFRALVADDIPGLPPDQIRNFTPERLLGWGEVVTGSGNGTLVTTGTGFVWSGDQLNLTTNLQGWSGVATSAKQDTLVSGTNIRTVNGNTLLGSSDLVIATGATTLDGLSDVTITSVANGQVLTYDSGTSQWINAAPSGGGGLTNFTESVNTSAPNATVPVVQLLATNAATNVDAVFSPKGTGAILARVPTGTSAGGDKRGSNAIDLQVSRSTAAQVASGNYSVLVGGERNRASGTWSICLAGIDNIASSTNSVVLGGTGNNCSGPNSVITGGSTNTASASTCVVAGGEFNQATGDFSWIPGGRRGLTRGTTAAYAWSGAVRAVTGDNQVFGMTVQRTTTDATPVILPADRGTVVAANVMTLPNNSCWTGTVHITGRSSGGDVYYLRLDVVGARGASAATTTVKATNPAYTFTDTALVGVSAQVIANTTRGSLEVEVTGLAATTIDWFAHFDAGNQIVR